MKILIRQVSVCDPESALNGQTLDVLIDGGRIVQTGELANIQADNVIEGKGSYLLPGFTDLGTGGGEPGFEHRETIKSLLNTAAAGGFTNIFTLPNLHPVTDSLAAIEYLLKKSSNTTTTLYPMGSVSSACNGNDISEMLDMHSAGVNCFTDGYQSIQLGGLILRALLYAQTFDGIILNQPYDQTIFSKGHMHEGIVSTSLGLKGIPTMAETIMLQRDLQILEYTGGRLHVWNVSSEAGVDLIRKAKEDGLRVTASVPVWNLIFTDEALGEFDPMMKLSPPLRSEIDRQALIHGLKTGVIDCITSGHTPLETEKKELEFPFVTSGAISLQTAFALSVQQLSKEFTLEELIRFWSINPAKITGLKHPVVEVGQKTGFTVFDPDKSWTLDAKSNYSRSQNSPLWNKPLKGKIRLTINNDTVFYPD